MKQHFSIWRGLAIACLTSLCNFAPSLAAPAPVAVASSVIAAPRPPQLWSPVQDKNFYLLSLLERTLGVPEAIETNPVLKKLATERTSSLGTAFNGGVAVPDSLSTLLWSQADIDGAAAALRDLYRSNKSVREMVDGPLRQSGMYQRLAGGSGEDLLGKAWQNAAGGLNQIVTVYGLGGEPHYPKIDSAFYDVKSPEYTEITDIMFGVLAEDKSAQKLFFQPSLRAALVLLDANRRDEAGRFEPLERGQNAAAYERIAKTDWARYPYSLILAPGQGPEEPEVHLSPKAKLVLAAIARRYREGKAPFIMVSGGYVHPNQTPFCEAIEMKKALIHDYGVPENAIIIDPHARHTTTNLRNAARLIYRYGIPFEKTALITTTPAQIRAIDRKKFQERCATELGYQPVRTGKSLSTFDLEFVPLIDSLQIDPTDPLDP